MKQPSGMLHVACCVLLVASRMLFELKAKTSTVSRLAGLVEAQEKRQAFGAWSEICSAHVSLLRLARCCLARKCLHECRNISRGFLLHERFSRVFLRGFARVTRGFMGVT